MLPFLIGILLGLAAMWVLYTRKTRQLKIIEQDKQLLEQEKQIVVEFMHNMVEAVAGGGDSFWLPLAALAPRGVLSLLGSSKLCEMSRSVTMASCGLASFRPSTKLFHPSFDGRTAAPLL